MEAKHTPGPWIFNKIDFSELGDFEINSTNGFVIAETVSGMDFLQQEANARLIAAAPELLEALQKLVELANESDGLRYGTLSAWFVRDIAEAAIAKATGQE